MKRLLLALILFAAVLTLPTQADFFDCTGLLNCGGSPNPDILCCGGAMNGLAGNDILIGNDLINESFGEEGDDVIFGGAEWDRSIGGPGHDTILPGPDGMGANQDSVGGAGNDTFIVLVGETANCQEIFGDQDFDVLHLVGFGPYIAEYPFGQIAPVAIGWVVIQDPVAAGYIFVRIIEGSDFNFERINGLPSPNVTILDDGDFPAFRDQNCTIY